MVNCRKNPPPSNRLVAKAGDRGMEIDFLSQLRYNVHNYVRKGGGWMSSIG